MAEILGTGDLRLMAVSRMEGRAMKDFYMWGRQILSTVRKSGHYRGGEALTQASLSARSLGAMEDTDQSEQEDLQCSQLEGRSLCSD